MNFSSLNRIALLVAALAIPVVGKSTTDTTGKSCEVLARMHVVAHQDEDDYVIKRCFEAGQEKLRLEHAPLNPIDAPFDDHVAYKILFNMQDLESVAAKEPENGPERPEGFQCFPTTVSYRDEGGMRTFSFCTKAFGGLGLRFLDLWYSLQPD